MKKVVICTSHAGWNLLTEPVSYFRTKIIVLFHQHSPARVLVVIALSTLVWVSPEKVILNTGRSLSSNKKSKILSTLSRDNTVDMIWQTEESPVRVIRGGKYLQVSYSGCELTLY